MAVVEDFADHHILQTIEIRRRRGAWCIMRLFEFDSFLRKSATPEHGMSERTTSISLLERLRDPGDADAWRCFHDHYGPWIRSWLIRRGLEEADADDVRQEALQRALSELPRFRHNGQVGALRCWLRQVVANRLKTFWRQKNRHGAVGGSDYLAIAEQLSDPHSELSQLWDREHQRAVCERLLSLAEAEFQTQTVQAFRLVILDGRKPADVAAELGMTPNAVRIAQSRMLRRLRALGEGLLDDSSPGS